MKINILFMRFVLLLLLLFSFRASFSKVFIHLKIDDCANCSLVLKEIWKLKTIDTVYVVFPSKFEMEKDKVINKFGLNKTEMAKAIFSDSLIGKLSKFYNGPGSSVLVFNSKDKLLYKSSLKEASIGALRYFSFFDRTRVLKDLSEEKVNYKSVSFQGGVFFLQDYFGNVYTFSPVNGQIKLFVANDDDLIEKIYKTLYGKKYEEKFPFMNSVLNKTQSFKPSITSLAKPPKSNDLVIAYKIRDYFLDKSGDTMINIKNVVLKKNMKTKLSEIYLLDKNQKLLARSDVGIWSLIGVGSKTKALIAHHGSKKKYMMIGDLDYKDSLVSLKNVDNNIVPQNYYEKAGSSMAFASNISRYSFVLELSDSVYNIAEKKMVKIPHKIKRLREDDLINSRIFYDPSGKYFTLYYFWYIPNGKPRKVIFRIVQFTNNGELISDFNINEVFEGFKYSPPSFVHSNQFIILDQTNKQIRTVDF